MRSKGRLGAVIVGGLTTVVAIVVVIVLGFVGVNVNATSGTQPRPRHVAPGLTGRGTPVRRLGASGRTRAPGARVRVAPLCVVDVVTIEGALDSAPHAVPGSERAVGGAEEAHGRSRGP